MRVLRFSFFILFTGFFFFSMGVFVGKSWSDRQSISKEKVPSPGKAVKREGYQKKKKAYLYQSDFDFYEYPGKDLHKNPRPINRDKKNKIKTKKNHLRNVQKKPGKNSTKTSYTLVTPHRNPVHGKSERWNGRGAIGKIGNKKRFSGVFIDGDMTSGSETVSENQNLSQTPDPPSLQKDKVSKKKKFSYTIQVAAYKTEVEARNHIQDLVDKGFPAFLMEKTLGGGKWFRVNIGNFKSKKQALGYEKALKKQTWIKKSFVRKISRSAENQSYVR